MTTADHTGNAAAWLSMGVESLILRLQAMQQRAATDFDVLVVGSGYGGAVAAAALASPGGDTAPPVSVCVLERGKEYLPGAFPSRMADLGGHVRISTAGSPHPAGEREGLFDLRIGADVNLLLANGLGGGSLINAGVMLRPPDEALQGWPVSAAALAPFYACARRLLGAENNTILEHRDGVAPLKFQALAALNARLGQAGGQFSAAPITVAMRDGPNAAGVQLNACKLCGDCTTGCNFNAKDSLDTNLLVRARRQGAELFTGATVLRIEHEPARDRCVERWCVHLVFTDAALRARQRHPFKLYAGKLILAAGSLGSTEILMRSRSETLEFSPALGHRFSTNGDMITVAYRQDGEVNAIADEDREPCARAIGPTITGMISLPGMLMEELAIPAPLRRLFEEAATTADTLHRLGMPDDSVHRPSPPGEQDPCAVDAAALRHSSVLAMMGDDGAGGTLELVGQPGGGDDGDGAIRVRWPALRDHPLFQRQSALLAGAGAGAGTMLANPLWKLLPDDMEYLLTNKRGPLTSVHPLGGCAMADDIERGVTNQYGQVYRAAPPAGGAAGLFDTLAVLDGAIIPSALGVNPALTIAAVALRAVEQLRQAWGWGAPRDGAALVPRPSFRAMPPAATTSNAAAPTLAGFVERMAGIVTLADAAGVRRDYMVELTLPFEPIDLASLVLPRDGEPVELRRTLRLAPQAALRLYDASVWEEWKTTRDPTRGRRPPPLLTAALSGRLDFMQREASTKWRRIGRTILPWLLNRGLRDIWQWWAERRGEGAAAVAPGLTRDIARRLRNAIALASRGGEVRRFDYFLKIGTVTDNPGGFAPEAFQRQDILGCKRLTYGRAANPWRQLTRLSLTAFPAMAAARAAPVLELDTGFLVERNIALMRILSQRDQPSALGDVAGLGGYLLRVLLNIHVWSFRKPDTPAPRAPQRLPGAVPGLPMPRITDLEVGQLPDGTPVRARLTRYPHAPATPPLAPVMLIHGYSASGTSYAHPLVSPNLASHLWHQGRDVWILDLRTSSGMPTAHLPWTFEDAAHADIPAAVDHIVRATAQPKIDIVAHCMGGAMLGMAILGAPRPGERFAGERAALPRRIGRLVLSQVGPLVVFTQSNIFRAYLMGYLRRVLPLAGYRFRIDGEPSLLDELIDRAFATLPYPEAEFHIENPVWPWRRTPYVGTRHRMDALYGRDFALANLSPAVLENIDDFFGPLNLETVAQAIHLARQKTISTRAGRNVYVSRQNLRAYWRGIETMSIHGADNGLADVATLGRMRKVFKDAGLKIHTVPFDGFGHQDCLIGRGAPRVFERIAAFLAGREGGDAPETPEADSLIARVPWSGPVRNGFARADTQGKVRSPVGAATSPVLAGAVLVAMLPVVEKEGRFRAWRGASAAPDGTHPIPGMELYGAVADRNGWIELAHGAPPAGADGMLMLVLYDASGVMDDKQERREISFTNPLLQNIELLAATKAVPLALSQAVIAPEQLVLLQLLKMLGESLARLADNIDAAIDAELDAPGSADRLRGALLAFGGRDATANGGMPSVGQDTLCFALASCQYPAGLLDQVPAYASYGRLAALLDLPDTVPKPAPKPQFLVLMGDQIYADATAGLFDPTDLDDRYVRPYEKLFGETQVQAVLRRLPTFMMLDDHEIGDNWEGDADPERRDAARDAGLRSYFRYQRNIAQPWPPRAWYDFEVGGVPFFMADTRSEREARLPANLARAWIMGRRQWRALRLWLLRRQREAPPGRPIFIVTPSIVAPRRLRAAHGGDLAHSLRSDAWDGYPASLHRLLAFIARRRIENVVFLSGDEHISLDAVISVTPPAGPTVTMRSIHSSGLYAPYPFANTAPADLMLHDAFAFSDPGGGGGLYHCRVESRCCPGDGFAVITVTPGAAGWTLGCRFDRAGR